MSGDEKELDLLVSRVLLGGVLLSVTLIVTGCLWSWFRSNQLIPHYELGGTNLLRFCERQAADTLRGGFRPRLVLNLGIIALMLTPWTRVLISTNFFAFAQRNWKYTIFTFFVLAILTWSLTME